MEFFTFYHPSKPLSSCVLECTAGRMRRHPHICILIYRACHNTHTRRPKCSFYFHLFSHTFHLFVYIFRRRWEKWVYVYSPLTYFRSLKGKLNVHVKFRPRKQSRPSSAVMSGIFLHSNLLNGKTINEIVWMEEASMFHAKFAPASVCRRMQNAR